MLELFIDNHAKAEPETVHVNAGKPKKDDYLPYEMLYENIAVC